MSELRIDITCESYIINNNNININHYQSRKQVMANSNEWEDEKSFGDYKHLAGSRWFCDVLFFGNNSFY